ncbi:MAG: alpha/beta hydrolase [Gammaproteobacteria bacterium]
MRSALTCCILLIITTVTHAENYDPSFLANAQGTYRFEDGACVTGGRMDEDGIRLLYTDVWTNQLGILAESHDGKLTVRVPLDGSMQINDSGDQLVLTDAHGHTQAAHRVHKPDTHAVRFNRDGLTLAGTLYTPHGVTGRLPGVVLAQGSGPVDRFGGPWITFFTDLGFAVLSYDKRGVGESEGDWHTASYLDLAGDLDAAIDWLSSQPQIDPARVGIHSTSQSGWYAPLAAANDKHVHFLIQRAGPALWIGPVTQHENENDWRAAGLSEAEITPASALWLQLNRLARNKATLEQAQHLIDTATDKPWFKSTFGENWRHVDADAWHRRQINASLDPAQTTVKLKIPVLWFLAEKDQNVPYAKSKRAIEDAERQHHADITLITVPKALHSFLYRDAHGTMRYTDDYWPVMAHWLHAKGITQNFFAGCQS